MRFLRHYLLAAFLIFISFFAFAQDSAVVSWKANAEKISDGNYLVKFTGTIKKGWHIYTLPDRDAELSGLTTAADDSSLAVKDFTLITPGAPLFDPVFSKKLNTVTGNIVFTQNISVSGPVPAVMGIQVNYEVADKESFYPESASVKINTGVVGTPITRNRILIASLDIEHPLTNCKTSSSSAAVKTVSNNLLTVFLIGFVGGLASLLLPCLFPMIPLTVSFFTNKAGSRRRGILNAFLYGFFIFLIYVGITVPFHIFEKLNPAIFK